MWAAVLAGAGLGLAWGVAARLWMRLITTDPEFSVTGTAYIIGSATQLGAFAGLAFAARRRGWRGGRLVLARVLAVVPVLPLGFGGGVFALGIVVPIALAVARWRWWRIARAVLLLLGLGLLAAISVRTVGAKPGPLAPVYVPVFVALMYVLVLALCVGLAPVADEPL